MRIDGDPRRFAAAQAQAVIAEADFHGVAKGSETQDFNFFALEHAHLQKALDGPRILAADLNGGFRHHADDTLHLARLFAHEPGDPAVVRLHGGIDYDRCRLRRQTRRKPCPDPLEVRQERRVITLIDSNG